MTLLDSIKGFPAKPLVLRQKAEQAADSLLALRLDTDRAAASTLAGEHAQRKTGAGEKFWQFREYDPADRPQDIDWRQSAKTDRVFVRQKEKQNSQTALTWCADTPGMHFSSHARFPDKAGAAKTLCLALSILMVRAGEQAGLLGGELRPGRTDRTLHTMAEIFCRKNRRTGDLPEPVTEGLPNNSFLILAGDFLSEPEAMEDVFRALAGRASNGLVLQVLDPAELELPYTGRVIFRDPQQGAELNIPHVSSIRDGYIRRIDAHINEVRAVCRRLDWGYQLHRTDRPVQTTLESLWNICSHHAAFHQRSG